MRDNRVIGKAVIRGKVLQSFDGLNGHSIDFTRS